MERRPVAFALMCLAAAAAPLFSAAGCKDGSVAARTAPAAPDPTEPGKWTPLAPMPTARHDLELIAAEGKLYAISGADDFTTDVVEVYDPKTRGWTSAAPIPEKRGWFGCAILNGKVYCVGGKRIRTADERAAGADKDKYEYLAGLNIYDIAANRWTQGAPLAEPRAGLKAVACGGKIYAIAGNTKRKIFLPVVEVYDPRTDRWTAGAPLPEGRMAPGVAAVGDKVYVIGGSRGGHAESDTVFLYDTKTGKWSRGSPIPTRRRDFPTVVIGRKIWCVGGLDHSRYLGTVAIYDTETDTWSAATPLPRPKAWMGAALLDGRIYVAGGADRDEKKNWYRWLDEFHVYLPRNKER